jgi:hypothetical protein
MRFSLIPTMVIALPLTAHAGFQLEATPSAGPLMRQPMPHQRPQALPMVQPPRPKPIAEGFGHEVPLTSALRDILPDGVRPELTAAVDPTARVNWLGGKPWDVVLQDAVKPLGVTVRATATTVVLSR